MEKKKNTVMPLRSERSVAILAQGVFAVVSGVKAAMPQMKTPGAATFRMAVSTDQRAVQREHQRTAWKKKKTLSCRYVASAP
mmetsp:Transcript_15481/g.12405  ORF Transcript_15481/g.12405 Transcript_15481/m.12405 type:complete len:82 (+) Transcript_15481:90-335(+)